MGNAQRRRRKERRRARRLADGAWEAAEEADLEGAEKRLRRALKVRQGDPVLWSDLGLILWKEGRLREAEKAFTTSLLLRPEHSDARILLAELLASRGFYRQAARQLDGLPSRTPHLALLRKRAEEYRARAEERSAAEDKAGGAQR
jgi:Flp pilus assembly protein TadD